MSADPAPSLQLASDAFAPDGELPARYTADGENTSPPMRWTQPPDATRSFVLLMEDLDARHATHWLLYDLPPDLHGLLAGPCGVGKLGRNDYAAAAYQGPCPAPGTEHRYCFRLLALRCDSLGLPAGATRPELDQALRDQVLAEARTTVRYRRRDASSP